MKVVYESNTGHAERYAEMLAQELKIESISLKEYKKDNEPIIFIGWVFGNNICGLDKVKDCNLVCVCAVGMSFESEENTSKIVSTINIDKKLFYLQGGLDLSKLKGIKKMILKMVSGSVIKENKPENKDLIDMFKNGRDYVKKENLVKIVEYVNNFKYLD